MEGTTSHRGFGYVRGNLCIKDADWGSEHDLSCQRFLLGRRRIGLEDDSKVTSYDLVIFSLMRDGTPS